MFHRSFFHVHQEEGCELGEIETCGRQRRKAATESPRKKEEKAESSIRKGKKKSALRGNQTPYLVIQSQIPYPLGYASNLLQEADMQVDDAKYAVHSHVPMEECGVKVWGYLRKETLPPF